MTSDRIPDSLRLAWDATPAAPDEPDARHHAADAAGRGRDKTKGTAADRKAGNRFAALNAFVDFTQRELSRAEIAVWFTLYRDTKPDGLARTSQADLARRAGVNVRTAKRAVLTLWRRGLLTVVFRGNLRRGPSIYRVRALEPAARK